LIDKILAVKGPAYLCDEIRRDEDPTYVQERLEREIGCFVDLRELNKTRILDFGCGSGASTFCLARLFPESEIVGVELDEEFLAIAEARKVFYESTFPLDKPKNATGESGNYTRSRDLKFVPSSSGTKLPAGVGSFDLIVLSAVYEHLLPGERQPVLTALWSALKPGGVLFINQTPNRWFPVEQHTTGLPLVNYLPDCIAGYAARKWSRRGLWKDDWSTLLRKGIRGGSVRGIVRELTEVGATGVEVLRPVRVGARDEVDLWYRMSSPRWRAVKRILRGLFRAVDILTGIQLVPAYVVMAVRKRG
jgi:SAM-dependent methyltransferase